jgi:hypothetical protein
LGMMRTTEGGLHYYINGEDQGLAIDGVPSGVYAVIDLYGVCGQVGGCFREQVAVAGAIRLGDS